MCGVCHAIRPAKASPCGACLSGTLPEMEPSGRQGPQVPLCWVFGAQVPGEPGPLVFQLLFSSEPGPEILEVKCGENSPVLWVPSASLKMFTVQTAATGVWARSSAPEQTALGISQRESSIL